MSCLRRACLLLMLLVIAVAAPAATPVAHGLLLSGAKETTIDENPLIRDAGMYASHFGVDLDEAIRRLELQGEIGDLNARLATNEGDTFAGIWIQHQPEYRVIVQFTRDGEAVLRPYVENGPLAHIVEVRTARATFKELEAARAQAAQIASKLDIGQSSAINVYENRAELYVLDPAQFGTALQEANLQLPANVQVLRVKELPKPVVDLVGGRMLYSCTGGFTVQDPWGTKGITTAGHCADVQQYEGVWLPWMNGTTGGVYDIQWNNANGLTARNLVWDGTYNRYIYNVKFVANQVVGEWVCIHGGVSGYACNTILVKNVDGVNVGVRIPVVAGDSGSPWFWNNTAYGTTISGCTFWDDTEGAIYGPVDHIYNVLGLTVLTN